MVSSFWVMITDTIFMKVRNYNMGVKVILFQR